MAENRIDEQDILNFALNLEYLEAEFYTYATTGKSITSFGIGIKGRANGENPTAGGNTVGGKQVTFSDNELFTRDIAAQIGSDERAHVVLLRGALGSAAVAKPNIDRFVSSRAVTKICFQPIHETFAVVYMPRFDSPLEAM